MGEPRSVVDQKAPKRVVWILGAGFSVPLGGPLFRRLISPETLRVLRGWDHYQAQTQTVRLRRDAGPLEVTLKASAMSSLVCQLYLAGQKSLLWEDAEQFLERLAIAAAEQRGALATDIHQALKELAGGWAYQEPAFEFLEAIQLRGLDLLHTEALRFVAGACTAFLVRAGDNPKVVDESEQWQPYRRWFSALKKGSDAIITFNYDRAPDLLEAYRNRKKSEETLGCPGVNRERFKTLKLRRVPIYRMHGHVGWQRSDDGESIDFEAGQRAPHGSSAYIQPKDAVIGIPGDSKLSLPEGLLKPEWTGALAAIEHADAIVFVGYRFPETDNMAKCRLMDALKDQKRARLHVVLGANNIDTPRVQAMLEWARPVDQVRVHPLWAQDFLAVFDRDRLFGG